VIDTLMTVQDVAAYLGVPVATVYQWNSRGHGPTRYRLGKHVRYRRSDVEAWVDRQAAPVFAQA
jgi:excisionase family DNA binding protein